MSKKNKKNKVPVQPVRPAARVPPAGNVPPTNMPEELIPVYDWYKEKGRDFLLTLALTLIAVIAFFAVRNFRARQNQEASAALASATDTQGLENLDGQYGKTKVAPVIRLRLARARYDDGNYQGALDACDAFLKKNRKHELVQEARILRGASLEALGKYDEAIAAYEGLSEDPAPFVSARSIMGRARCLAAKGDKAGANALLDGLVLARKGTKWETRADDLRGVINRFEGFRNTSIFDRLGDAGLPQANPSEEVVPATPAATQEAAGEDAAPEPKAAPEPTAAPAAPAATQEAAGEAAAPEPTAAPEPKAVPETPAATQEAAGEAAAPAAAKE